MGPDPAVLCSGGTLSACSPSSTIVFVLQGQRAAAAPASAELSVAAHLLPLIPAR